MNAGLGYILELYVAGENRASESQLLMQRRRMERKLIEFTRERVVLLHNGNVGGWMG